jgi:acetylornithine deacetylase/succinyl-diaminopimelate desuccinylase-like protein
MIATVWPMQAPTPVEPALREVVERLAGIDRAPGSAGEAAAADWIAERLRQAGCEAEIERAQYYDG